MKSINDFLIKRIELLNYLVQDQSYIDILEFTRYIYAIHNDNIKIDEMYYHPWSSEWLPYYDPVPDKVYNKLLRMFDEYSKLELLSILKNETTNINEFTDDMCISFVQYLLDIEVNT
jgi:hypothetical protein